MFSQFRTKRNFHQTKFPANNKKTTEKATASARSIQKDTPQLFFEMAEAEDDVTKSEEEKKMESALTTLLYMFWSAEILWLLAIIVLVLARLLEVRGFLQQYVALVFLIISTALLITNSVFLCLGRVPGRGQLSKDNCSCDRPCCMSKPYTIASTALILPNIVVLYFVALVLSVY